MPATTVVQTLLPQAKQAGGIAESGSCDLLALGVITSNGDGTYDIAKDPTTGVPYQFVFVNLPMDSTDASNVSNSMWVYVGWSWDDNSIFDYTLVQPYQWIGGVLNRHTQLPQGPSTNPQIPVDGNGHCPKRVCIKTDPGGLSLNFGVQVAFGDG